jgi:hypothetical protein
MESTQEEDEEKKLIEHVRWRPRLAYTYRNSVANLLSEM